MNKMKWNTDAKEVEWKKAKIMVEGFVDLGDGTCKGDGYFATRAWYVEPSEDGSIEYLTTKECERIQDELGSYLRQEALLERAKGSAI